MGHSPKGHSPKPLLLIAENQLFVALNLEDQMETAGFQVAGPFRTSSAALAWLERHTPDCALTEVFLGDGFAQSLAHVLFRRGVPHVVHSEIASDHAPPEFAGAVAWMNKPARSDAVLSAVLKACRAAPRY